MKTYEGCKLRKSMRYSNYELSKDQAKIKCNIFLG